MASTSRLEALVAQDPAAARKLLRETLGRAVVPHEGGQREVLLSDVRFNVLDAGRRWGKTKIAAKKALRKGRAGDKMIWWVAPTYKVVKRGYREVLKQLPKNTLTHSPPPDTAFDGGRAVVLKFVNGTQMEFYSAERPGGMLGEGVDFAVLDEAAQMQPTIWQQYVRPTLMDHKGGALMISTPRGRNWFYDVWLRGQDELDENWASWQFPSWANPLLTDEEIADVGGDLPRLLYQQEIEAKFLAAGANVFAWDPKIIEHNPVLENGMVEGAKISGHVVLGIDLAKTADFTVIYGAVANSRRDCFYLRTNDLTWGEQKRRIARSVKQLRKAGAETVTLVMDSTGVGDPIVEDMEERGYDVVGINFTTHKNNMVKLLAKDLEDSRAFLLEEGQLSEFENYALDQTPKGKVTYAAPAGQHDDAVSAKMLQHYGIINEGAPAATVVSADDDPDMISSGLDDGEAEDWDDLIEDDDEAGMLDDPGDAAEAVGLPNTTRPPTVAELLTNPDVWSSYA